MRLQLFAARLALGVLVLACFTALTAVAAVRLSKLSFADGLTLMTIATILGLVALISALTWLFSALRRNSAEGRRGGLIALVGSLALLGPPVHNEYMELTSPSIHDATTNPEDPPQFVALARIRQPGANSPVYDGSRPIHFHGETNTANYMLHTYYDTLTHPYARLLTTKAKLFWHAFETAKAMGWHIADFNEKEGRIEATDSSFWFGQTADIVIRVQEAGSLGARLDVRSQSENGTHDFGGNIARLQAYLKAL